MAPDANIRYYASSSCFDDDFLATLGRVVDENVAQVVTNSWSDLEQNESAANVAAYEQVFKQGALQGQSFLFSSGDNGDELANSALKQVDYPASDPYVTAAGGTSTGIDASGAISMQTGWGTQKYSLAANGRSWTSVGYLYGAGGGYSALFNRPSYQNGVVANAARGVPDVSMDADPSTGMLIGQTQTFPDGVHYGEYRIGGTSLTCRCWPGSPRSGCRRTAPASACSARCSSRRQPGRSPTSGRRRTWAWSGSTTRTGSTVPPGCSTRSARSTRTAR